MISACYGGISLRLVNVINHQTRMRYLARLISGSMSGLCSTDTITGPATTDVLIV
jgi:hypothetical protein